MVVSVLVVDDSAFFRRRILDTLGSDSRLSIVGTASNGQEAVEQAKALRPDIITMDVEMPKLNGIEAVRQIMRVCPTTILMLSSLTHEGARITLDALSAGAVDYLTKDTKAWIDPSSRSRAELIERVVQLGRSPKPAGRGAFQLNSRQASFKDANAQTDRSISTAFSESSAKRVKETSSSFTHTSVAVRRSALGDSVVSESTASQEGQFGEATYPLSKIVIPNVKVVAIGSSTGGPSALQHILTRLPAQIPFPILLIQHMPNTFTKVFAERLNQQSSIQVREATDGDYLEPGLALLCPGGMQMIIDPSRQDRVKIFPGDDRVTYKPSVDISFASLAKVYKNKVLGIMLTGMGADGCDGSRLLKQAGGQLWAQSKLTCTIFGMPQAVIKAGLSDAVIDLENIAPLLSKCGRV